MKRCPLAALVIALVTLNAAVAPAAEEDRETKLTHTARQLLADRSNAVVFVTAVLKISPQGSLAGMMGGERDQQVELLGTMIDKSGLTLVSWAALDPTTAMQGAKVTVGGQQHTIELKTEVTEVRIRLADGTEVRSRLLLKDEELDLAFIAPEARTDEATLAKMAWVDLAASADKADILDIVIHIGRLGKDLNFESTLTVSRIYAVVTKPRTFYLAAGAQGTPVFTDAGKLLGFTVARRGALRPGQTQRPVSAVVLPVADVRDGASQALEAMK